MNLNGDGKLDGKFVIQRGQGISQAIAAELGLNENDCKRLGSIWNQIIDIAKEDDTFTDDSKKYSEGMVLEVGDKFEFNKNKLNQIIQLINNKIGTEIQGLQDDGLEPATATDEAELATEDNSAVSDDKTAEEPELTEEKLPSVLLRNTAFISTAAILKAIKNPAYRKKLLPSLKNLTPKERAAFDEACKKFDDAKANKLKLKSNIKSGKQDVKSGETKLTTIENAEKKLADAKTGLEKAKAKVQKETELLKKNPKYQKIKQDYKAINDEINKLEKRKAGNKSGKLSANNEAKLTELKNKKADILKQKQKLEKGLTEAKSQRAAANKNLKNAQYDKQMSAANKKVSDLQNKCQAEKNALKQNSEYKKASSELRQTKSRIKALETKANSGTALTSAEQAELKGLKAKQQKLSSKIKDLSKSYSKATAELKAAQAEAKTIKGMASNSATTKSNALSRIKKGKQKVRINLKKLPKSYLNTLQAGLGKTKAVANVGGKMLRGAGKVAKPVMAILAAADIYNAYQTGGAKKAVRQTAKLTTSFAGAWAGAKGGAALGATIGSFGGPVGTAVGGCIGGIAGGFAGWWAGEKTYDAAERIVLPTDTPLGQEQAQNGELEMEMSEEELREFLTEYPIPDDAIEWVE